MMEQKLTTTATKGIIIGLILICIALAVSFSGLGANSSIQYLGYLVFAIGIIFSISQYGKQINYNATFGNYFGHGFKVSAIVTVIMIIFLIVFMMVFPEFKEKAMEEAKKSMNAKNLPQDQIDKAIDIARKFFMVFLIGGTLVGYLIFGAISSLIGAAVTKKNPNNFSHDINQIGS